MKGLIVFGADDGARLALIARSPASFESMREHLGTEALHVAHVIVGHAVQEADERVKATAAFFMTWAAQDTQRRKVR